jgi:hypothetical protein
LFFFTIKAEEHEVAGSLYRRIIDAETRAVLDAEVREKYISEATIVMFGAGFAEVNEKHGVDHMLRLKHEALLLMKPWVEKHGGRLVEEALWIFRNPHDAVRSILAIRQSVVQYNQENERHEKDRIPLSGFGVHHGEILCLPGTNVHWGDPGKRGKKQPNIQDFTSHSPLLTSHLSLSLSLSPLLPLPSKHCFEAWRRFVREYGRNDITQGVRID